MTDLRRRKRQVLRRGVLLLIVLQLVGPLGCRFLSAPLAAATPTSLPSPTLTATATQTPTSSPEPTQTSTLQPSVTLTPVPTSTQTPLPTEIPRGYYRNSDMGVSFIAPRDLRIEREEESWLTMEDSDGKTYIDLYTFLESSERPIEDWVEEIATGNGARVVSGTLKVGEVDLADGGKASAARAWLSYRGYRFALQVVYAYRDFRSYLFLITSPAAGSEDRFDSLDRLYETVSLFMPGYYGLEHDLILVQTGYEPEDSELDPARSTSGTGGYLGLLYSGLVRLSPDLTVVPDLAERWTLSQDGRTYTFHLRPGGRFASGKLITAQDFKDSWERAANPKTGSPTASAYLGDIVGVDDMLSGKAESISGVEVINDYTLQVTIDAPKPYFLAKLASPAAFVIDVIHAENAGNDWMFDPNASGPYQVRKFDRLGALVFERNPNYYAPSAIPYLVYLFYGGGSLLDYYRAGYVDILNVRNADVPQVRNPDDPLNTEYQSVSAMCTSLLQFSNTQPPMDDINVRKAFTLAVDKAGMVERLTGNIDLLANTILPPGMPGYSSELVVDEYIADEARSALAASSYAGKLPPVVLNAVGYGDSNQQDVSALVDTWREVLGVDVQVEYLYPAGYAQAAREQHGQMVLYDWCADYPDPENFLDMLFHSTSVFNVAGYDNQAIDGLLEQARVQNDPTIRIQNYQEIEQELLTDYASLPILHPVLNVLVKPRVKGFVLLPIQTMLLPWISLEEPSSK